MEQISLSWEPERRLLTVSELTSSIRTLLGREFFDVWVAGEISGTRTATSGHIYFTLKDETAQLRCVCFRSSARLLRAKPTDGMAVLVRGRIDVYDLRGEYQLLVEALEPQGYGALQFAFEQLKKKLAAEGLFDSGRKRALPKLPRRVGIVTSPTGAVVRDIVEILARRFPGLWIRLYPAAVQGPGSAEQVVEGIEYFSRTGWAEVVIAGRGGGSIEDLWTFNDEAVARAIARSRVPVVSAVGHETDFTIADFVADLRAATPSAAAEMVAPLHQQVAGQVEASRTKLVQAMRFRVARLSAALHQQGIERARAMLHLAVGRAQQRVDDLGFRMKERQRARLDSARRLCQELERRLRARDLRLRLGEGRRRMEALDAGLGQAWRRRATDAHRSLEPLAAQLVQLSPLAILERGYAIVETEGGRIVRDAAGVPIGSGIGVRLWRGRLRAVVTAAEGPQSGAA